MKNIIKAILIIVLFNMTHIVSGQTYKALKVPAEPLLGTWTAYSGNFTYEIEFKKEDIYFPENDTLVEYILGKITYKVNGYVKRQTEYDGMRSIVYGRVTDSDKSSFTFQDRERKVRWRFDFIFDASDPTKATWKWWKLGQDLPGTDWNKENTRDIPDGLTFRKVGEINQTDPGGGAVIPPNSGSGGGVIKP